MPLAEYAIHRVLMHQPWPWRSQLYIRHHVMHHGNNRNDLNIDLPPSKMLLYGLPLWAPALAFDAVVGITLALCVMGYGYLWSKLHRAFHNLEVNWTVLIPRYYEAALNHHRAHHANPRCNLGTVFYWTDRLFGTRAKRSS